MKYSRPEKNVLRLSLVLLTLAFSSRAIAQTLQPPALIAQAAAPAFPVPSSVPSGTTVKLDGSGTMTAINQALKQRFEQQFSGSKVEMAANGTEGALQALLDGKIDVAAIGRALTDEEKAKGLVEAPISREKIAIITSPENPFRGDISFAQFAKIFRGEITNWSELGGAPGVIRMIDRPETNDTRLSLSQYKVFKDATFAPGANTVKVAQDDVASVIKELGKDGISYGIASQVLNQPDVHVVSMHKTLPNDPRYPYSQPRGYVYNKDASPTVQAFLGFAGSPAGQEAIKAAKASEANAAAGAAVAGAALTAGAASPGASPNASPEASPEASPNPSSTTASAASPNASASAASPDVATSPTGDTTALLPAPDASGTTTGQETNLGWLWWLLLPLLGGLFWWLFKRDRRPVEETITGIAPPPAIAPGDVRSREVSTTREVGTREVGVSGRVPPPAVPPAMPTVNPPAPPNPSIPKPPTGTVPPVPKPNLGAVAAVGAAGAAGVAGAVALADRWKRNRMTMTPSDRQLNINWNVPADHETAIQEQGGQKKLLRLYDVTNVDLERQAPNSVKLFDCDETSNLSIPLENGDRDYIGELGYSTHDNRWIKLARSPRVHVPTLTPPPMPRVETASTAPNLGAMAGGAAAAGIAGFATIRGLQDEPKRSTPEPDASANDSPWDDRPADAPDLPSDRQTLIQTSAETPAETPEPSIVAPVNTDLDPVFSTSDYPDTDYPDTDYPDNDSVPDFAISTFTVNSRANCFVLEPHQMQRLQSEVGVSKALEPGNYIIRIKSGSFSYRSGNTGEPLVMLWIYGGRVMNLQTQVPVEATWSTLNGYDDSLHLQVFEPATLCAFFFDTHLGDNEGEVTLTTTKL
jgi:phosphate transport system substrate-binding protein